MPMGLCLMNPLQPKRPPTVDHMRKQEEQVEVHAGGVEAFSPFLPVRNSLLWQYQTKPVSQCDEADASFSALHISEDCSPCCQGIARTLSVSWLHTCTLECRSFWLNRSYSL